MQPAQNCPDVPTSASQPGRATRQGHVLLGLLATLVLVVSQLLMPASAHAQAGQLDPTFGQGGKVTTDFAGDSDQAHALVVQRSTLVAAGSAWDHANPSGGRDFALARYRRDGTLDPAFGVGGKVTTDFAGYDDVASALAVQADGKLVAAGWTNTDFGLARYNRNGTLDRSFGRRGKVTTDFAGGYEVLTALAVQADGKLVAAGWTTAPSGEVDFALARYHRNGTLDRSFGRRGRVTTDFAGSFDQARAIVVWRGKLIAGGLANIPQGRNRFALARYNRDGTLDRSFGRRGKVTTDFAGNGGEAAALAVQGGKLIAAGLTFSESSFSDFAMARYNRDGTLDRSFGRRGRVTTDFAGSDDQAKALAVHGGKLIAGGFTYSPSNVFDFALARYHRNGILDTSFGSGGKVTTAFTSGWDEIDALVTRGGKVVAAGQAAGAAGQSDFALARYHTR